MSTWMNESAAAPSHNGNAFPLMSDPSLSGAMMDPAAAFLASPGGQFNPAPQFQNAQQMAAMSNGPMRNASPTYQNQNPAYQTNSVIPSKRARPHEDGIAASPRQNPNMLPPSRSDTPQQGAFPGMQGAAQPMAQHAHLQPNGSSNASPSPMIANQQIRPGSVPHRVSTASPHPFSPSTQQFPPQGSPVPSDHSTPQPGQYMQNMGQGFNPNMAAMQTPTRPPHSPNNMPGGMQMMPQQMGQQMTQQQMAAMGMAQGMTQQQMAHMQQMGQMGQMANPMFHPQQMHQARTPAEQQKLYQMQLQRQMQQQGNMQAMGNMAAVPSMQMNPQMHQQNMQAGRGMMQKPPMQMANGQPMQQPGMRPQPRQPLRMDPQTFVKNLTGFMNSKGLPLDLNPTLADKPINIYALFQQVQGMGGYKAVTASNAWAHVSVAIGFNPGAMPGAPQMLKTIYDRNLWKFEEALAQRKMGQQQHQQQQQQQQAQQQQAQPQQQPQQPQQQPQQQQAQQHPQSQQQLQGPHQQQMQPQTLASNQVPSTPTKQVAGGQQNMMAQGQGPMVGPSPHQQGGRPMHPGQQPTVNGFSGPHAQAQAQAQGQNRNSMSRGPEPGSAPPEFPMPPSGGKPGMAVPGHGPTGPVQGTVAAAPFPRSMTQTDEYTPCSRQQSTYGGVNLESAYKLGSELAMVKPDVPPIDELGFIDIQALSRSLQSGIHGEVRLALDTLAAVTSSPMRQHQIILHHCEDLLDVLLECAEEQVELLAEHTVQVSDEILLVPYEDVVRSCKVEQFQVREVPVLGSPDYELDRAVDRLVCITTILRNLSFPPEENHNHVLLADEEVIKFLCVVIRYLGTRTMLLRTNANTLDFMKDVVVLLSNISISLEITGREQAMCLLQFLLAFAPTPGPMISEDSIYFLSYDPALHPYLPHAVDSLAKILARDEPNRSHYKAIFAADIDSPAPYELLTRAFGLAISPVPDQPRDGRPPPLPPLVEARKPFVMQGLLAAEILSSLAPGYDSGVVKMWLSCGNGLSQKIYRLIQLGASQFDNPPRNPHARGQQQRPDDSLVCMVVLGVTLLRRLIEKSRDPNDPKSIPPAALPPTDSVLSAMMMTSPEWTREGVLQQLLSFLNMDS
ncbi:related to SWI1 Component of SWI/SNF global transcription activator complex [Cephalotrichum gorgonifer]|uniref:Related to SWI1 Component of SWI/SNF global transcription activator complex n=1 Tax=Cephalotrichum gorgonifer TaxID=2041049 RepID=A0AAE8SSC2_9PEZI|nr:related to SWI1 Component of SWI/SNF global transcription activator complex [Cephalotrichum gorgonifer]